MFCPRCGAATAPSANFCTNCGVPLGVARMSSEQRRAELYKAVIGPRNQDYYLNRFRRFDEKGSAGIGWHWPAFIATLCWLLYRRMNALALAYVAVFVVGFNAIAMAGRMLALPTALETAISLVDWIAVILLPPLCANALYYRHCKARIARVEATTTDYREQLQTLARNDGTSGIVAVLAIAAVTLTVVGILSAVALPAYRDYNIRTQVGAAISHGNSVAAAVTRYFRRHETLPDSLATAGANDSPPPSIGHIQLDAKTGTLEITMTHKFLARAAVLMIPSTAAGGRITWRCTSRDIAEKYLPPECRH